MLWPNLEANLLREDTAKPTGASAMTAAAEAVKTHIRYSCLVAKCRLWIMV